MKKNIRSELKRQYGICEADNPKKACVKCLYHKQKICQIHGIKTAVIETCDRFTSLRKAKVFRGGSVSPR